MKLVFYSGGAERSNHRLHREVSELVGRRSKKRMTYFAFCTDYANVYYGRCVRRYRAHGVTDFKCFIIDQSQSDSQIKDAFNTDIIYLSGGNTFYILKHLKRLKLLPELKKFVKRGGVLAGLSAGAIIMTPHIGLAGYPKFDCDSNDVGLYDLRSLGLVDFEFFPHYRNSSKLDQALLTYSSKSGRPIYACSDGGGIVMSCDSFSTYGSLVVFYDGLKFKL